MYNNNIEKKVNLQLQSDVISILRFPLSILVVLIHASLIGMIVNGTVVCPIGMFPIYESVSYILCHEIARIAVPLFFIFSGFLFFYNSPFSFITYKRKMRKRLHTLLVPYLFWNTMILLMYGLVQMVLPRFTSGQNKVLSDFTLSDWGTVFWDAGKIGLGTAGAPVAGQLWFVRDLMIMVILTPIIYLLLRYIRLGIVVFLGGCWLLQFWPPIVGISIEACFFFTMGAYMGIYNKSFTIEKNNWVYCLLYFIALVVTFLVRDTIYHSSVRQITLLLGMIAAISLSCVLIKKRVKINNFFVSASFFIYVFHAMPVAFVNKVLVNYIHLRNDYALIGIHIISSVFIILLGLLLYSFFKKFTPFFCALVTGER